MLRLKFLREVVFGWTYENSTQTTVKEKIAEAHLQACL